MADLIDRDAIKKTIEEHVTAVSCCPTVDWSRGKTQMKKQVIEDIDNAPTIDAIPVDWFERRLNDTAEATARGDDQTDLNNAIFTVLVEWEKHKKDGDGE